MLSAAQTVIEIGCGDGFGARIVRQEVRNLTITDYDPVFIDQFTRLQHPKWEITAKTHDITVAPLEEKVDVIYSLDVLEHIPPTQEQKFLKNICLSLQHGGIAVIGMPSLESQIYASAESKQGHVNCKTAAQLQDSLKEFFQFVFIFSMNDEVVHTGFHGMAHYLIALCCGCLEEGAR